MIYITKSQFGYDMIKFREIHNVKKGWKRLAKKNFDEIELGYDEFEGRLCLIYQGIVIPRQIKRKSKTEKLTDGISESSIKEKELQW